MTEAVKIIAPGFEGWHNSDVDASSSRIIRGAAWKKQRIIVLVPAAATIPAKIYLSHCSLIFPPNQPVYRMLCLGTEVGSAYSTAIKAILEHPDLSQWEYVLTIEHDNAPPQDGVLKLIETMDQHPEYSTISGLYWTKGFGGVAQCWGDINDPVVNFRPVAPKTDQVIEVHGTGMGFALWRLSMFKDQRLRQPWFETKAEKAGVGTQDLWFWGDARKHGYRCAVDCRVRVGHYDMRGDFGISDFMW